MVGFWTGLKLKLKYLNLIIILFSRHLKHTFPYLVIVCTNASKRSVSIQSVLSFSPNVSEHLFGNGCYCFIYSFTAALLPELNKVENMQQLYLKQDGAPPNFGAIVTDALTEKFGHRWMGRKGPLLWPHRSSYLEQRYCK